MSRAIPEVGHLIETQNQRGTSDMMIIVQEKIRHPTSDEYADGYVWIDSSEGESVPAYMVPELELKRKGGANTEPYRYVGYMSRWEFVSCFFTEKAANEYIKRNRHDLGECRTHGISLWNNPEMKQVRELLLSLAGETP
ncbi:MAG: hypothetical protein HN842_10230 [Gammaproteobacteria bacterium]|jgi:hypothetical protein|nr:hypothetical protein [Gammaproteobacteria bacterium]